MIQVEKLLANFARNGGVVRPPAGPLVLGDGAVAPSDLLEFYSICGGMVVPLQYGMSLEILRPEDVVSANPVIAEVSQVGDISDFFYLVARVDGSEYISIDLHPDRLGRCYDSSIELYGLVGDMVIIAESFTEFLKRGIGSQCKVRHFWLESDFYGYGDAYD